MEKNDQFTVDRRQLTDYEVDLFQFPLFLVVRCQVIAAAMELIYIFKFDFVLPEMVHRQIMGDSEKPCCERSRCVESGQGTETLNERIERYILSVVVITDHPVDVTEDPTLVQIQYSLAGTFIPGQCLLYQCVDFGGRFSQWDSLGQPLTLTARSWRPILFR